MNSAERQRLKSSLKYNWKKWGPYLTDRQWGTVREDYSPDGDAWEYVTHDDAGSRAYRWGEEGIAGISDDKQILCFALSFWNGQDPILKERYFGLSGKEGNHGEDVKEYYYYLDNTPVHSYMKMLYKYPQSEFPYNNIIDTNKKRGRSDPEYELADTGIFNEDKYFDIFIEYCKNQAEDILIRITAHNRGEQEAQINIIPQLWFRNTWSWGYDDYKPKISFTDHHSILAQHKYSGNYNLYCEKSCEFLFCDNETNVRKLYGAGNPEGYFKDGINDYIVDNKEDAINPHKYGTRAAANFKIAVSNKQSETIRLRLTKSPMNNAFEDFDKIFENRIKDADEFYSELQFNLDNEDERNIQRQAFAGMLWNKQFYFYDIPKWLKGDPGQPPPPEVRLKGRNSTWFI